MGLTALKVKRVYEQPEPTDGQRILVERLWPRGLSKEKAAIDLWLKDVAPSTQLRQWYAHDASRWPEFQKRYRAELRDHRDALEHLADHCTRRTTTLVYAAHDEEHNSATVLRGVLQRRLARSSS